MSTTALVSVAARLKADLERNRRIIPATGGNYINVEDGKFILPDGKSFPTLTGIILDFRKVFTFYKNAFNPKVKAKPDCFAIGMEENEMRPDAASPKPQHGESCESCPQNAWKSAVGGGKRCKNMYRIAIIPADNFDASAIRLLMLPPTSIKNLNNYINNLAENRDLVPAQVVTTISLDSEVNYTKFQFDATGIVDDVEMLNAAMAVVDGLLDSTAGLIELN